METKTNSRNDTAVYDYDPAGRISTLTDAVDTTSYRYDKNGNLTYVIGQKSGTIKRDYDALNRVISAADADGNTIGYTYDEVGNLTELTYPNGKTIQYQYDRSGLLTKVIDFNGGITSYTYDNNRRVVAITRPNGTSRTAKYDVMGQMTEMVDQTSGGKVIASYSYKYDAGGNIIEEKQKSEQLKVKSGTISLEYGKGNRLMKFNGQDVSYDADGNMIYGPLGGKMVNFTYDARNRLIQAGSTTYLYDAENNRVGKIEGGVKTTYVINTNTALSQVLVEKKGSSTRTYIYGLGLIMHTEGGAYTTYHFDSRGSTVAVTNGSGTVTDTFTYGPYAELISRTGKTNISFLFNGRDGVITDVNGLYYMRARYYNPTIKRFINQDVVQGSLDNAISLNRFAYANGNPISNIDPFGLSSEEIPDQAKAALRARGWDPAAYSARSRAIASEDIITMNKYIQIKDSAITKEFQDRVIYLNSSEHKNHLFSNSIADGLSFWSYYAEAKAKQFGLLLEANKYKRMNDDGIYYFTPSDLQEGELLNQAGTTAFEVGLSEILFGSAFKAKLPISEGMPKTLNPSSQINGTSYDINKVIKTQPYTYPENVAGIKETIMTEGPNAVPPIEVRVYNGEALVIDGHHRLEAFNQLGYDRVPIKYISGSKLGKIQPDGTYYRSLEELLAGKEISNKY